MIFARTYPPITTGEIAKTIRDVLDSEKEKQMTGRVLVIDDDSQMRAMLKQVLEKEGYDVIEAADGNAGIKSYRENLPDLVITDLIMPEKEGVETIMELKKDFPDANIIAASGGGRNEPESYLQMAKQLGAARVFAKPIDRSKLMDAVRELLK